MRDSKNFDSFKLKLFRSAGQDNHRISDCADFIIRILGGADVCRVASSAGTSAQRAHRLVSHGGAPVLSEGCEPLISGQDASPRYRLGCVVNRSELPRERFSRVLGMFSNLEVKVLYPT